MSSINKQGRHCWRRPSDGMGWRETCSVMNSIDPERLNRKEALKAISRAVRIYWEHKKALPIPDHLVQLAAKADEALAKHLAASSVVSSAPVESEEPRGPA